MLGQVRGRKIVIFILTIKPVIKLIILMSPGPASKPAAREMIVRSEWVKGS